MSDDNLLHFPGSEVLHDPRASEQGKPVTTIDFSFAAACLFEIVQQRPSLGRLIMSNIVGVHRSMERFQRQLRTPGGEA